MPAPAISKEIRDKVREERKAGAAVRVIARRYKVSQGWVSENTSDLRVATVHGPAKRVLDRAMPEPLEPVDPVKEAEARVTRNRELSLERELLKDVAGERSFRSFLDELFRDVVPELDPPPKYKPPVVRKSQKQHVRYPLLHLSDWHWAELVKPESVLGMNHYDAATARRRIYRVIHAFLDAKRDWEASGRFRYPKLTVALNGDFLTGTIHGLERHTDAANIVRATLECADVLALALRDLAANFETVECVGTVGNHGRLPDDRKVPTKDPTRSWDYMAYAIAQRSLAGVENIEWLLPDSYGVVYEAGGQRVFQGHGHFLKQQLNTPVYSARRFVSGLQASRAKVNQAVDLILFGHWHAAAMMEHAGARTFVNPALIGTQEFSFNSSGDVSVSAQDCYIVDEHLGYVGHETFYGEGPGPEGTY